MDMDMQARAGRGGTGGRGWSRREALAALAATAALPIVRPAGAAPPRVGIVGGGMAGVALAWLLDGVCEVVLLEARAALGGNVQTVELDLEGEAYSVDTGAQFFHPGPYPTYVKLLESLGLYPSATGASHAFPASITVQEPTELRPRFLSPVVPGRVWPVLAPWNSAGIQAFAVAFGAAKLREAANAPLSLTLGDWLPQLGLTAAQVDGMLLPWAASLYSGDIEQARSLSARSAMIFAAEALPDNPAEPIQYFVLNGGMIDALAAMASQFTTVQVHTGAVATGITRQSDGGLTVHCLNGLDVQVDQLVLASSGPPSLALLAGVSGTAVQRAALQGIEFHDAQLMLHTDPVYAPANPAFQSFLNCEVRGAFCEASMRMADVLVPPPQASAPSLWKSWVTHRQSLPAEVLHEAQFKHLLPTPASLYWQAVLRSRQGEGGIWFAGGYTLPFDSQETALLSALAVANGLGVASARSRSLNTAMA